ncbi:CLUMA_CG008891, isoform A [Clunio marinus]|uniref:CLUMA_CG008891, isoform A n=1 Tax=Clunio marinus TaxID=568069 RepID=A0A1J1I5A2_9DIPT|nr:CLUMA_CG008891, isoform A [Clunio marinus]
MFAYVVQQQIVHEMRLNGTAFEEIFQVRSLSQVLIDLLQNLKLSGASCAELRVIVGRTESKI